MVVWAVGDHSTFLIALPITSVGFSHFKTNLCVSHEPNNLFSNNIIAVKSYISPLGNSIWTLACWHTRDFMNLSNAILNCFPPTILTCNIQYIGYIVVSSHLTTLIPAPAQGSWRRLRSSRYDRLWEAKTDPTQQWYAGVLCITQKQQHHNL